MIRFGMVALSDGLPSRVLCAVIWDFNGTLIDDTDLTVRSLNVLLARRGLPLVDVDSYRCCVGFPLSDYYERIGLDVSGEGMSNLAEEFYVSYLPALPTCRLHHGVVEVLKGLRAAGVKQFVLSASEERVVRETILGLGVNEYFEAVVGLNHRLVDSKIEQGRQLIRSVPADTSAMLLIGDTDHDAEVGDALGIPVLLVAQGHQDEQRLRATGHRVFADLEALHQVLMQRGLEPDHA